MTSIDKTELDKGLLFVKIVADAIKEARQIPSGHLYAMLCGVAEIETYQKVIGLLERAKLVRKDPGYLLVWTGP